MGEALVRQRAKQFRQQQDEAFQKELQTRHLFSNRPEVYATDYTCLPKDSSAPINVGRSVLVRRPFTETSQTEQPSHTYLEIIDVNRVIGVIEGAEATTLLEIMASDERCHGIVNAEIVNQSKIDSSFNIRCVGDVPEE